MRTALKALRGEDPDRCIAGHHSTIPLSILVAHVDPPILHSSILLLQSHTRKIQDSSGKKSFTDLWRPQPARGDSPDNNPARQHNRGLDCAQETSPLATFGSKRDIRQTTIPEFFTKDCVNLHNWLQQPPHPTCVDNTTCLRHEIQPVGPEPNECATMHKASAVPVYQFRNRQVGQKNGSHKHDVRVYFLSLLVGLRLTDIRLSLC